MSRLLHRYARREWCFPMVMMTVLMKTSGRGVPCWNFWHETSRADMRTRSVQTCKWRSKEVKETEFIMSNGVSDEKATVSSEVTS